MSCEVAFDRPVRCVGPSGSELDGNCAGFFGDLPADISGPPWSRKTVECCKGGLYASCVEKLAHAKHAAAKGAQHMICNMLPVRQGRCLEGFAAIQVSCVWRV